MVGNAMEPDFGHDDLAVFRRTSTGSRQEKVLIVEFEGAHDLETGGSFAVRRYRSQAQIVKGELAGTTVVLEAANPSYETIVLTPEFEADIRVVGEFITVLKRADA
jgi:SOS-response transcriptional repressor LexA